jgi:hypothetical protein
MPKRIYHKTKWWEQRWELTTCPQQTRMMIKEPDDIWTINITNGNNTKNLKCRNTTTRSIDNYTKAPSWIQLPWDIFHKVEFYPWVKVMVGESICRGVHNELPMPDECVLKYSMCALCSGDWPEVIVYNMENHHSNTKLFQYMCYLVKWGIYNIEPVGSCLLFHTLLVS